MQYWFVAIHCQYLRCPSMKNVLLPPASRHSIWQTDRFLHPKLEEILARHLHPWETMAKYSDSRWRVTLQYVVCPFHFHRKSEVQMPCYPDPAKSVYVHNCIGKFLALISAFKCYLLLEYIAVQH